MKLLELEIPLQYAEHAFGTNAGSATDLNTTIRDYTELVGPIAYMRQVHGNRIAYASEPGCIEEADAIYTDCNDIWLAVSTADCVPVLVSTPSAVAAVHCGWRGLESEILPDVIKLLMDEYGHTAIDTYVHIGPCISQKNYEVEDEYKQKFDEKFFRPSSKKGYMKMDLVGIVEQQARDMGVPLSNIHDCGLCTYHEKDLFNSHRRNKKAGSDEYQVQISLVRRGE